MNEAAKLVADSALNIAFKTIWIGGQAYTVHPPTMKGICRILSHWSMTEFEVKQTDGLFSDVDAIKQIPRAYRPQIRGIASAIVGEGLFSRIKERILLRQLNPTSKELVDACDTIKNLMGATDFFQSANLAKSVGSLIAKQKL